MFISFLLITDTFHLIRKLYKLSNNYACNRVGQTSGRKRSDGDDEERDGERCETREKREIARAKQGSAARKLSSTESTCNNYEPFN